MTLLAFLAIWGGTCWLLGWHHARLHAQRTNWQQHTWETANRHPSMYRPHRTNLRLIEGGHQLYDYDTLEHDGGGAA